MSWLFLANLPRWPKPGLPLPSCGGGNGGDWNCWVVPPSYGSKSCRGDGWTLEFWADRVWGQEEHEQGPRPPAPVFSNFTLIWYQSWESNFIPISPSLVGKLIKAKYARRGFVSCSILHLESGCLFNTCLANCFPAPGSVQFMNIKKHNSS